MLCAVDNGNAAEAMEQLRLRAAKWMPLVLSDSASSGTWQNMNKSGNGEHKLDSTRTEWEGGAPAPGGGAVVGGAAGGAAGVYCWWCCGWLLQVLLGALQVLLQVLLHVVVHVVLQAVLQVLLQVVLHWCCKWY
jgi:hypothetical protein